MDTALEFLCSCAFVLAFVWLILGVVILFALLV
jgi:hypothetical protein